MGTRTKTTRDTKVEAEVERIAKATVLAKKLAVIYIREDQLNIWKCIDYTIEMITLQHLTSYETGKVWKKAFSIDDDSGDNNNMASTCSRLANVGMFFALNNERTNKLYKIWKNKCGIHSIYYKVRDIEGKANKRISKKVNMSKEQLQKEADEGVANAQELADSMDEPVKSKSSKKKEETKGFNVAESYSLDKDIYKALRQMLRGEPIVYYRMVVRLAGVHLLSEEWEKLALEEIEKLG